MSKGQKKKKNNNNNNNKNNATPHYNIPQPDFMRVSNPSIAT